MACDVLNLLEFSGTVRLFPLPNLVLFPNMVQALHIFEPRYRQLLTDAIDDDLLMACVLLQDGWQKNYDGRPPIENVACLGRIIDFEKLPDGRYNLRLQGLSRIRVLRELQTKKPYRVAEAELVPEIMPASFDVVKQLHAHLAEAVLPRFPEEGTTYQQLNDLFHSDTPLGLLCDFLSYALPLPIELKQQLLAECDVKVRAEVLTDALNVKSASRDRKFPPDFSIN